MKFNLQNFLKKNEVHKRVPKELDINIKDLKKYSKQQLLTFVDKYNQYSNILQQKIYNLNLDVEEVLDAFYQLQENNNDLQETNIDLNNRVNENEIKIQFKKFLPSLINKLLDSSGIFDNEFRKSFLQAKVKMQQITKVLDGKQYKQIDKSFEDSIETEITKDQEDQKSLQQKKEEIEQFQKDFLQYFNEIKNNQNKIIENIIIVMNKFVNKYNKDKDIQDFKEAIILKADSLQRILNEQSQAILDKNQAVSELKHYQNKVKNFQKKYNYQKQQNLTLLQQKDLLQERIDSISRQRNVSENEMTGHMEIVRLLQQENYKLNIELQDKKKYVVEQEDKIKQLQNELENQNLQKNQTENKHASIIRQQKLKVEQLLKDNMVWQEKYEELEIMLRNENERFENLYKKYKEIDQQNNSQDKIELIHQLARSKLDIKSSQENSMIKDKDEVQKLNEEIEKLREQLTSIEINSQAEIKYLQGQLEEYKNEELRLTKRIMTLKKKIQHFTKNQKNAQDEVDKLNSIIHDMSMVQEETILFNEQMNTNRRRSPSDQYLQSETTYQITKLDKEQEDCLRKVYNGLKSIYKNYVIIISGPKDQFTQKFNSLEKQLNDLMEFLSLYINQLYLFSQFFLLKFLYKILISQ